MKISNLTQLFLLTYNQDEIVLAETALNCEIRFAQNTSANIPRCKILSQIFENRT